MILLINAISIKEGGSLVVLRNYVEQFSGLRPDMQIHITLNTKVADIREFQSPNITIWTYPRVDASPFLIKPWYETMLPQLVRSIGADALFSLTNYLPSRPAVPSLLLVQHAGHFSETFMALQEKEFPGIVSRMAWRFKNKWVKRSVATASYVTVQTESLANAIRNQVDLSKDKVKVIPHGLGLCAIGKARTHPGREPFRIGYVTKYGVQKNFNVIIHAAALLKQQGLDVRLTLTLDAGIQRNRPILQFAKELGIADSIDNFGDIAQDKIQQLYDSLDVFVFPSLCESFGLPMLEAMARGLPLLIADTLSNREICGNAAVVFSPHDPVDLSAKLTYLINSLKPYNAASQASIARAKYFSWKSAAEKTVALIESMHAEHKR